MQSRARRLVAFLGTERLVHGLAEDVVLACRHAATEGAGPRLAIYDASNGRVLDIDLRGDEATALARLETHAVLSAPRTDENEGSPRRRPTTPERRAREAAYRFMHDLVGDIEGFEEASRALFAGDDAAFARATAGWPADVREQIERYRRVA